MVCSGTGRSLGLCLCDDADLLGNHRVESMRQDKLPCRQQWRKRDKLCHHWCVMIYSADENMIVSRTIMKAWAAS